MKVHLMYQDRDLERKKEITPHEQLLIEDLGLNILFEVMARGDKLILEIVKNSLLASLINREEIIYRQNILQDCINNPHIVRKLYELAGEAILKKSKQWWGVSSSSLSY